MVRCRAILYGFSSCAPQGMGENWQQHLWLIHEFSARIPAQASTKGNKTLSNGFGLTPFVQLKLKRQLLVCFWFLFLIDDIPNFIIYFIDYMLTLRTDIFFFVFYWFKQKPNQNTLTKFLKFLESDLKTKLTLQLSCFWALDRYKELDSLLTHYSILCPGI